MRIINIIKNSTKGTEMCTLPIENLILRSENDAEGNMVGIRFMNINNETVYHLYEDFTETARLQHNGSQFDYNSDAIIKKVYNIIVNSIVNEDDCITIKHNTETAVPTFKVMYNFGVNEKLRNKNNDYDDYNDDYDYSSDNQY